MLAMNGLDYRSTCCSQDPMNRLKTMSLPTSCKTFSLVLLLIFTPLCSAKSSDTHSPGHAKHVILYIWDGLRNDAVSKKNTPELYALMQKGVAFTDHHASYPSLTMMNAASFATGDRAGNTGFYGNVLWHPGLQGTDFENKTVDFEQPVFTEDYKILQSLEKDRLFFVKTLFMETQNHALQTATIGKSGPAFMQDYLSKGIVLDEKHVTPLSFAKKLQQSGAPLPKSAPFAFSPGELTLTQNNGDPTAPQKFYYFSDGVTSDALNPTDSPFRQANDYLMRMYLTKVLPTYKPQLSVLWMRTPDAVEHTYGPGTPVYYRALRDNDRMLGLLIAKLKKLGIYDDTDILIASDHAHSTISGPLKTFPLRDKENHIDPKGLSVSGAIRTADLLTRAGFHAFDGGGCRYNPVMSGILKNGKPLYPTKIDKTGSICGKQFTKYTTPSYKVPHGPLPKDAIVVAPNGGSVYLYIPSHNQALVAKLVRFLQGHTTTSALFVDSTRYSELPGTLPLATIRIQSKPGRTPDVIASFSYDASTTVNGLPGIEFSDSSNERGMHGSFSPVDIHNFLAASGPDFQKGLVDSLPTANVDLAPTIAHLLSLPFSGEGRVLFEALSQGKSTKEYTVKTLTLQSNKKALHLPTFDVLGKQQNVSSFQTIVHAKALTQDNQTTLYFDFAEAKRQ